MSTSNQLKLDPEKVKEIPMVDLAFMILKAKNEPHFYRDLMKEVAEIRGMSEQEVNEAIAQLYTEINIDGRFACVGTNLWGLKRWYPVERSEDPVGNSKRPRIINDDDDELEDDTFTEDEDGFNSTDSGDDDFEALDEEPEDELFPDEDDDVDEDVEEDLIDDEELEEEALEDDSEGSDAFEEDDED